MLKNRRRSLKHVADGGTLAEEVISTIRTAQAFGTQKVLSGLYNGHVDESRRLNAKAAIWHGFGLAIMFFVIYSSYALGKVINLLSSVILTFAA
jgi:ATP-binding cassette subfamily B (MDR/TAP) protein 1